jgi:hypothetical protein
VLEEANDVAAVDLMFERLLAAEGGKPRALAASPTLEVNNGDDDDVMRAEPVLLEEVRMFAPETLGYPLEPISPKVRVWTRDGVVQ